MVTLIPKDVENLIKTLSDLNIDKTLIKKAQEILSKKADDILAWNGLGITLSDRKNYDAALVTFDIALLRFPGSTELYTNKGVTLLEMELYEESFKNFSKALDIEPNYI